MNDFSNTHPILFLIMACVAFVAVPRFLERLNILLHGHPPPKPQAPAVDLEPVMKRLDGFDTRLRGIAAAMNVIAGMSHRPAEKPAPPSGDPFDRFKRDVSGMSPKERVEAMRKAREWMFGDTKAEKS